MVQFNMYHSRFFIFVVLYVNILEVDTEFNVLMSLSILVLMLGAF